MKLILNGGGDGIQVKESRILLNNIIDHTKKILYIPLAWPNSDYDSCHEFIINELSDIDVPGIDMIKSSDEIPNINLYNYSCIYIGGGNTYKLLNELKRNNSFNIINNYLDNDNSIIYGGSAGAIIFGHDLDSCNIDDLNDVGLIDNNGFNKIDGYSLLCHYTNRDNIKTEISKKYLLELSKRKKIYAIPEEDSIYIDNDIITFIGSKPYYEFINGNIIEHRIGDISE